MQSTISIFRRLVEHLPPLLPDDLSTRMQHALEHLEHDETVTMPEIEDTMITFGYEIWPWNQAYREYLVLAEHSIGEHFLLPRLSPALQEKYLDFKEQGGSLRELHSGRPAQTFAAEERVQLCEALVEMQQDLHRYVRRELVGVGEKKYRERVASFRVVLEKIKIHLQGLRSLADLEQDHPTLAAEIRDKVRSFEYGLCLLGPELSYDAVCQSTDFFVERKKHLNRLRGIDVPVDVQFYSN